MSDLRTRIAALIYDTVAWRSVNVPVAEEVADAVIRELGLQREKNLPLGDERFHQPMHRYVTEWTTDE